MYDTILPIIHTNLIYELFLNEFLAILNNNTLIRLVYLLTSEVKNLCRMRNSNSFIILFRRPLSSSNSSIDTLHHIRIADISTSSIKDGHTWEI